MVLCTVGQHKYFDPQLLQNIKRKDNEAVMDALHCYCPDDFSSELAQLKDSFRETLLHYASRYGNVEIVRYLLDKKCEIDAQDGLGRSPLMLAIEKDHENIFEVLLESNANINLRDNEGKNALQLILELGYNKRLTMFKILFQRVSWQKIFEDFDNINPILISEEVMRLGNVELMKFLLTTESTILTRRNNVGATLLHLAVQKMMPEMVKVLVDFGADVDALDNWIATPLYYLYGKGKPNKSSKTLEMLRILTSRATLSFTQISKVLTHGTDEAIELILQSKFDLNSTDRDGNTMLHYFAENRNADFFKVMRGRKFDVNARNNAGITPLHVAAKLNSFNALKFLLDNGAEVNAVDPNGRTPLYSTFDGGYAVNEMTVEILLRYGADPQTHVRNDLGLEVCSIFDLNMYRPRVIQTDAPAALRVIARLAVVEGLGTEIFEFVRSRINGLPTWRNYLDECRRQVGMMKGTAIYGDVTLFRFLTGSLKRVTAYARNEELVNEMKVAMEKFEKDSPYFELIQRRLVEAVRLAELREKTVNAVCWLMGLGNRVISSIAENVVDYLSEEDMEIVVSMRKE